MQRSTLPSQVLPRVLAVDDYEPNLCVLAALLETLPIEVVTASTASEAVALAREEAFAVILMDVRMPKLSGDEAVALIRRSARNRHTPVVFLSGDELVCETLRSQGHDVLEKPYRCSTLLDKVQSYTQRTQVPAAHPAPMFFELPSYGGFRAAPR